MNSSIYNAWVSHTRTAPKRNHFRYRIGTFLLDLDELEHLNKQYLLFGYNSFSIFSFWDKDHIRYGTGPLIDQIRNFLKDSGYTEPIQKIYLNTNLRVLGYVFNPVSFYFCLGNDGRLVYAIAEVGNTFGEIKPYIGTLNENSRGTMADPDVYLRVQKNFYVSPFIALDSEFEFRLNLPNETLQIAVNSWEKAERILTTAFVGEKKSFCNQNLLFLFCRYPFVTVQIIALIHWQAIKLWFMRLPYIKKQENKDKQTGVPLGEVSQPVTRA